MGRSSGGRLCATVFVAYRYVFRSARGRGGIVTARKRDPGAGRRPLMRLLELLGRRWALRVLWELREAPLAFRALRERCDEVSPSVLNSRLRELREAGIVERAAAGYALTGQGAELGRLLLSLSDWSDRWPGGRRPAKRKAL